MAFDFDPDELERALAAELNASGGDDADLKDAIESLFGAGALSDLNADLESIERQLHQGSLEETIAQIDAALPAATSKTLMPGASSVIGSARKVLMGSEAKHVVFQLGESRYAIPIANVLEIQRVPSVTALPNVPDWVQGVCNLRGEIISIVDLRAFLNMDAQDFGASRRIIVTKSLVHDVTTGLVVDAVVGMRNLPANGIRQPTASIDDPISPFLRGVSEFDDQLIAVIDLERFYASDAMRQFEAV